MIRSFKALDSRGKVRTVTITLFTLLILLLPFLITNSYRLYFFSVVGMYIIAATGLDVLVGMSGQMSFGHIAFLGIGGYVSVLLSQYTGIPVIFCMLIAAFVSAGIGSLIAIPCAKLRAQFLILATIAFAYFIYQLICNLPILNPFRGLYTNHIMLFGLDLNSDYRYTYYFSFVLVVIVLVLKSLLSRSKCGRAMMAVRDNTRSADGMGINVRHYKVMAFAISAFLCGFAGAIHSKCRTKGCLHGPSHRLHRVRQLYLAAVLQLRSDDYFRRHQHGLRARDRRVRLPDPQ